MEFFPNNNIVQLCLQGMNLQESGNTAEATTICTKAWNDATNNFEKFLAAWFIARLQHNVADKRTWLQTALELVLSINSITANSALPTLYSAIATCYQEEGDEHNAQKMYELSTAHHNTITDNGPFYHGTKADLHIGDFLTPGNRSNYQPDLVMNHIYFTAMANGAGLAAALAKGDGAERVYIVQPTDSFENDPNVTDKKFPGNLTRSYRTHAPLKIIGELTDWQQQTQQDIQKWREKLATNNGDIIN